MHEVQCQESTKCKEMQEMWVHRSKDESKRKERRPVELARAGKPRFAVLRMEGTNCEYETFNSLVRSGADPQYVHLKRIENGDVSLSDFSGIIIPGGFSAGDYIRAGIIFASRLSRCALKDLEEFNQEGKIIVGICNGFQVLVEMGLLPMITDRERKVALHVNESFRFESRNVYLRLSSENGIFKKRMEMQKVWEVPVAHAEGRFITDSAKTLNTLKRRGQILFKYSDPNGNDAPYPLNPNGSLMNSASITNISGNIVGIMPHPERIYFSYQMENAGSESFGKAFFDSIVEYSERFT